MSTAKHVIAWSSDQANIGGSIHWFSMNWCIVENGSDKHLSKPNLHPTLSWMLESMLEAPQTQTFSEAGPIRT
ncbi:hypothetical protein ACFQ5Q_21010 [Luteolibacter ambystomatis]